MAFHSYGGKVSVDWTGGTTYVDLAEVVSFTGPDFTVTKAPSWHLQSVGAFKTTKPGMVGIEDAVVVLRYTKAQYAAFLTNIRTIGAFRFTFADTGGSTLTFTGFLAAVGAPAHGDDDTVNQQVSINATTAPVFVPAV